MKRIRRMQLVLIILLLATVVAPALTWAGGLYLSEVAPAEVGLASAGVAARAQDASTLFTNPAGMTRLQQPEVLFGLQPIYVHLDFDSDSKTSDSNQFRPNGKKAADGDASGWLPSGSTFFVYPVNKDLRVGIGVLGYFGAALSYDDHWVGRYYAKDVSLQGLTIMPSVAYKVNEWLSVGAGLNAMYAMMDVKVAVNNNPLGIEHFKDGQLEVDDDEWGFGGLFGVLVEPSKGTRFGLTYMTSTELDFNAGAEFSGLKPALKTILGNNGLLNLDLDIPIEAPQSVMLSGYHELNDQWAIMGNLGWQDWSEFGSLDIGVSGPTSKNLTVDLNYKDTWHVAAGVQYKVSEPLLLSLGMAYDSSMMDDEERSPALPLGEAWRFGTGAQYKVKKNMDVSLAYEFLWTGDMELDVNGGPLKGRVSGDYTNTSSQFINLALNWRF